MSEQLIKTPVKYIADADAMIFDAEGHLLFTMAESATNAEQAAKQDALGQFIVDAINQHATLVAEVELLHELDSSFRQLFGYSKDEPIDLATFFVQHITELQAQSAVAVAEERKRPFSIDILGMFREKFLNHIDEGDFDFTKILTEVDYEGETYVDISTQGMDDIVDLAAKALEMTLEHASDLWTAQEFAKEIGGTDGTNGD